MGYGHAPVKIGRYRNTSGKDSWGFPIEFAEYGIEFEGILVWHRFADFVNLNNKIAKELDLPVVLPVATTGLHRWFITEAVKLQRGSELCAAMPRLPRALCPPRR